MTRNGTIHPGTVFRDTDGRIAQLHGVGVQLFGDPFSSPRFWAWGEDKAGGDRFSAIACYSSDDLATWRFEGDALEAGGGELSPDRIVERPKVLARPDGRFVMFLHIEAHDYSDARVGYAIADHPAGPFHYLGSESPLGNPSRDIGVYQEDGVGYLMSEDRANGLHLYRLSDDYLRVESIVATTLANDGSHGYESPALVKHDGLYYLFGSDLTGWELNDNKYSTAEQLAGPWSPWADLAPAGSRTFGSQVSTVLPVGDAFVYVGDRWTPDDLHSSPAVWLPLAIGAGTARLSWRDSWTLADLRSPDHS